jgi:hypothetical protein
MKKTFSIAHLSDFHLTAASDGWRREDRARVVNQRRV